MSEDPITTRATELSRQRRESGHTQASDHLNSTFARNKSGGLMDALREACQTALTDV